MSYRAKCMGKEGWIIYSEIREKKGTVELGVEGNARLCSEHYLHSLILILTTVLQNRRYSLSLFS